MGGQSPGDPHPLLLSAGELAGVLVGVLLQSHEIQEFRHPGLPVVLPPMVLFEGVVDVAGHRFGREKVELLEDHADLLADRLHSGLGQGGHVLPENPDRARSGPFQFVDQPDQGGFAGAGITDDPEDLPLANPEGDVVDGHVRVLSPFGWGELLGHMFEGDEGLILFFSHIRPLLVLASPCLGLPCLNP